MSKIFDIEISGDLVDAIPRIKDQAGYARASAREMDFQNQLTVAAIKAQRLTGQGPFPVEDHRLGRKTGLLRGSVRASSAVILGTGVTSTIGSNVVYAAAHEFGVVIPRKVKAGSVKLLTSKRGELLTRGNLATFARTKNRVRKMDSHFKEVKFAGGKSYKITIPARAPIAFGIADRQPEYTAAFEKVTENFLTAKN